MVQLRRGTRAGGQEPVTRRSARWEAWWTFAPSRAAKERRSRVTMLGRTFSPCPASRMRG